MKQLTAEQVEEQTAETSAAESTDTAAESADTTQSTADAAPAEQSAQLEATAPDADATPTGTAAPSPEAAIGASAARPLGDAEEMAVKADSAVDEMAERSAQADEHPADAADPTEPATSCRGDR
jgi:hypothetical protein